MKISRRSTCDDFANGVYDISILIRFILDGITGSQKEGEGLIFSRAGRITLTDGIKRTDVDLEQRRNQLFVALREIPDQKKYI